MELKEIYKKITKETDYHAEYEIDYVQINTKYVFEQTGGTFAVYATNLSDKIFITDFALIYDEALQAGHTDEKIAKTAQKFGFDFDGENLSTTIPLEELEGTIKRYIEVINYFNL